MREDRITGPGGDGIYGVVTMRQPAVFVVGLEDRDRVCLVSLYRYATGPSVEVPAGGSDGEPLLVATKRELLEEIGFAADDWTMIGTMNALNGIYEAPEHVFLAHSLGRAETAAHDSQQEEGIDEVAWVPFGEMLAMVADGHITDGETVAAIAYTGIFLGRFR